MRNFYLANDGHLVQALAPVNINGGANSDVFSMENWQHASIIIGFGVVGASTTITLLECDDFTPTNSTAIAFNYYSETTAAGDTLGGKTAATTSGITGSTNNGIFYVLEVDSAELTDGYPNLRVSFSDPGASVLASVHAILSRGRYAKDQSVTAIA